MAFKVFNEAGMGNYQKETRNGKVSHFGLQF